MHEPPLRGAGWLVAAVLAASITACQSGGGDVGVPSSVVGTPGAVTSTVAAPPATEIGASEDLDFTTPSGNIRCNGGDSPGSVYLLCEVSGDRWQAPPTSARECDGDLISGRVGLGSTGDPELIDCATDAVPGDETLQGYGRPLHVGRFYCVARESGLRCENTDTGHGFELSQAAYEFF